MFASAASEKNGVFDLLLGKNGPFSFKKKSTFWKKVYFWQNSHPPPQINPGYGPGYNETRNG